MTSSQGLREPNWDLFWTEGLSFFQKTSIGKFSWDIITKYSARVCLKLIRNNKNIKSILELGGGSGCVATQIAKRIGLKSNNLTLIDKSREAKNAWKQLNGFGKYILGDFFSSKFNTNKYDLVFSDGLIEHWSKKESRLKVIQRHADLSSKYVLIRTPADKFIMNTIGMKKDTGYEKHYKKKELVEEISDAGLNVLGAKEDLFTVAVLAKK
jgi:SAM-dependent methyltransferase